MKEDPLFDLSRLKRESGLTPAVWEQLERIVREDFPDDLMLFELQMIRVVHELKEGRLTREQILRDPLPA